jgi:hypothetical protein
VAAFAEELIGMGLLEITGADLGGGNMRGNGQDGSHAAVGVEQSVDQVQIARTAAPGTNRQLTRELCLGSGRERRSLFVANIHPLDFTTAVESVGHRIEAVADETVNSLDTTFGKSINQLLCHGSGHD